jgi:hypothetical protein
VRLRKHCGLNLTGATGIHVTEMQLTSAKDRVGSLRAWFVPYIR